MNITAAETSQVDVEITYHVLPDLPPGVSSSESYKTQQVILRDTLVAGTNKQQREDNQKKIDLLIAKLEEIRSWL